MSDAAYSDVLTVLAVMGWLHRSVLPHLLLAFLCLDWGRGEYLAPTEEGGVATRLAESSTRQDHHKGILNEIEAGRISCVGGAGPVDTGELVAAIQHVQPGGWRPQRAVEPRAKMAVDAGVFDGGAELEEASNNFKTYTGGEYSAKDIKRSLGPKKRKMKSLLARMALRHGLPSLNKVRWQQYQHSKVAEHIKSSANDTASFADPDIDNGSDEAILMLIREVLLGMDGLVAELWPQFAPFCTWKGVACRRDRVVSLELRETVAGQLDIDGLDKVANFLKELPMLEMVIMKHLYSAVGPFPRAFGTLELLRELRVEDCMFTGVPPFANTPALRRLRLQNLPKLKDLPADMFSGALNLRELYIKSTGMDEVPESITRLRRLYKLSLSDNGITSLPEGLKQLRRLEVVYLRQTQMTVAPGWLAETTIMDLDLSLGKLESIEPSVHSPKFLQNLNLQGNNLKEVPDWVFKSETLITLNIEKNQLTRLPQTDVWNNSTFRSLNVGGNYIDHINGTLPISLKRLEMYRNRMVDMPSFPPGSKMSDLSMGDNRINRIEEEYFLRTPKLRIFKLDVHTIEELPGSLCNCTFLNYLNMRKGTLRSIPDCLSNLQYFRTLNIQHNKLISLPESLGRSRISHLSMSFNAIERMPMIPGLVSLVAKNNRFTSITLSLQSMTMLDLTSNSLEEIVGFGAPLALKRVNLGHNKLKDIEFLHGAKALIYLKASDNLIERLEVIPPGVRELDVSHNRLIYIADKVEAPYWTMDISHNRLENLPKSLFTVHQVGRSTSDSTNRSWGKSMLNFSHNRIRRLPDLKGIETGVYTVLGAGNIIGVIPPALLNSKAVKSLNFDDNAITHLPPAIMGTSLQSLSVQRNLISSFEDLPRVIPVTLVMSLDRSAFDENQIDSQVLQLLHGPAKSRVVWSDVESQNIPQGKKVYAANRAQVAGRSLFVGELFCATGYTLSLDDPEVCETCPSRATCARNKIQCNLGTYLTRTPSSQRECSLCPSGATCENNLLIPEPGYWSNTGLSNVTVTTVSKCHTGACLGGEKNECRPGHHGLLCDVCDDGMYKNGASLCVECPNPVSAAMSGVVIIVIIATLIIGMACLNDAAVRSMVGGQSSNLPVTAGNSLTSGGGISEMLEGFLRIMVGFTQVLAALPTVIDLNWGPHFTQLAEALSLIFGISFLSHSSIECALENIHVGWTFNFYHSLVIHASLPLIPVLVSLVGVGCVAMIRALIKPKGGLTMRFSAIVALKSVVISWLVGYIPISTKAFELAQCRTFDQGSTYWIGSDLATQCYTEQWWAFLPISLAVMVLYTFLFPAFIVFTLGPWYDKAASELTGTRDTPSYGLAFIHQLFMDFLYFFRRMFYIYRPGYRWFEALELIRRLSLTAIVLIFYNTPAFQAALAVGISFVSLCVHLICVPFSSRILDVIQGLQLVLLILTMYIALLNNLDIPDTFSTTFSVIIFSLDLVFIVSALAAIVAFSIYQASKLLEKFKRARFVMKIMS